jgi:hypothetical protein
MEQINETFRTGLVHRAVAFGMALTTTALIATSTAVVFTGATQNVGSVLFRAAAIPVSALLGS